MIALRMISVVVGMFFLLLMGWVMAIIIPPFYAQVTGRSAVQALGMDAGLDLAREIAFGLVLVGLGLALIIWYHVAGLREDVRYR